MFAGLLMMLCVAGNSVSSFKLNFGHIASSPLLPSCHVHGFYIVYFPLLVVLHCS